MLNATFNPLCMYVCTYVTGLNVTNLLNQRPRQAIYSSMSIHLKD